MVVRSSRFDASFSQSFFAVWVGLVAMAASPYAQAQLEAPSSEAAAQTPSSEMIERIIEQAWERVSRPPHYVHHVRSPDGHWQFALYGNYDGFDDRSWHVFRIDAATDPRTLVIPDDFLDGEDTIHQEWRRKLLFSSLSEAGHHVDDPHLVVVRDRYLVFVRGGLNHGLYDIDKNKVEFLEDFPWYAFRRSQESSALKVLGDDSESEAMDKWVRQNLHDPIVRHMSEN